MRVYYNSATPPLETWVRVSGIVGFPNITTRNNIYGRCVVTLRDFEGGLFDTWNSRDLTEMLVTDDADDEVELCNVLFRGYLMNKKFHDRDLVLEIAGIGIMLERRSFGSGEIKNYILAEGFPKTLNPNTQIDLHYKDSDGNWANFDWVDDRWIKEDKDVGLVIKDSTAGFEDIPWDSSAIAIAGGVCTDGDNASTLVFEDAVSDLYRGRDESFIFDQVITLTIDGAPIPVTDSLKEIKVEYAFETYADSNHIFCFVIADSVLQINKDGTWIDIDHAKIKQEFLFEGYTGWATGFIEDGTHFSITEDGDSTELAKYFDLDVGENNYVSLKGLRLKLYGYSWTGGLDSAGSYGGGLADSILDYIKVTIVTHSDDVLPIMYKITDSGNTGAVRWVKCSEVANWQEMGVSVNTDAFQIGENTKQIIQEIMNDAGLQYEIMGATRTAILRPNIDDVPNEWDATSGIGNHYADINEVITDPTAGDGDCISTAVDDETEELRMETVAMGTGYLATSLKLHVYTKDSGAGFSASFYTPSTGWSAKKYPDSGNDYAWDSVTWTDLELSQADVDALKIRFMSICIGGTIYIDTAYVTITYTIMPVFDKYMARKFKGKHCIEGLNAVLNLEGAEWYEDYANNMIKISKIAEYDDSGVSLTQTDYDHDWEYEDQCNEVKYVYVWGKTSYNMTTKATTNIFAKAVSSTAACNKSIQIIDDGIMTQPEAEFIAQTQRDLLETKRPSIRIPLNGMYEDLKLGTRVNLTMARPTIGAADYPIRMIQRYRQGKTGIKTVIYCGMGETDWDEKLIKEIKKIQLETHKSLTDRLESTPYDVGVGGVTWDDIIGGAAGAVAAVSAADDYLKNDANDTTTGDLTVANLVTAGNVDGVDVSVLKTTVDTIIAWQTAQHMRDIPYYLVPENGETEGDNNVSWNLSNGRIKFGKNSLTTGNVCFVVSMLPSDYVDGEDMTLTLTLYHLGAGEETVDYDFNYHYAREGGGLVSGHDPAAAQWTLTADQIEIETVTIDGTNFLANDGLRFSLKIECNDNAFHTMLYGIRLSVPVNTRD